MHSETLQITKPFDLAYKLMNMRFKPTDYVLYDEPFVLVTEIHCTSPWQLHIAASQFHPVCEVKCVSVCVYVCNVPVGVMCNVHLYRQRTFEK